MDNINFGWRSLHKGKLTTMLLGFLFLSLTLTAQSSKTAIVGTWLNQEKAAKVEIYQQGEKFFGKIVWLKEPNENGKRQTNIWTKIN